MVTKAADCTHLIAAKIARTEKFLCAMAVAPWILTEKWVYDSIDAGELLRKSRLYASTVTDQELLQPKNPTFCRIKASGTST